MEDTVIRQAVEADYDSVQRIMRQVQDMHVRWRPDIYRHVEKVLPYEVYMDGVRNQTFLVAECKGQVAGILFYLVRHIESSNQVTRDVIFIDSMAVDEKYRGQGIGHQLFDFVVDIKNRKHYDGVELQVNAKNAAARKMYEKYGFTEKSVNMELLI